MNNNEFVWEDEPRTLKEIMSAAFLPQVIKVYRAPGETPRDAPPDVMVLVREVGGSRVLAKVHTTDTKSKTEESHVRLVLIPAEYKGWFTLGVKHTPDQLGVIKSIGKVLEIMPHSFLTCSQITCFYELSQPENGADYIKGHIDANETLTVSSMHEGYIKYSNLKGKVKRTLERFLKVSTSSRKIALLRVKQEGLFYIVDLGKNRHTDTYDSVSVRRMKDILARNELPLTVYPLDEKDEFKPKPAKKSAQRQLQTTVELTETVPFRAAVACTLHSRGNQLLELPLQTDVKYLRAVKTPAAKHHEALRKTLIFADSHVDKFLAELRHTSDPGAS